MNLKIQQIRFSKDFFSNFESCAEWLEKEGVSTVQNAEMENFYVFDLVSKDKLNEASLQPFKLASGIEAITGIAVDVDDSEQTIESITDTEKVEPEDVKVGIDKLSKELESVKEFNSKLSSTVVDVMNNLEKVFGSLKPFLPVQVEKSEDDGEAVSIYVPIIKAKEEKIIFGAVLVPDEYDGQEHIYSEKEVEKAAHYWMAKFQQMAEMHEDDLSELDIQVLESYIAPIEFEINGTMVKKGTWLLKSYVASDELWEKIKSGEYKGYSMGGVATVEEIDETEE